MQATSSPARDALDRCVEELQHGDWKFIRLRAQGKESDYINNDDIDLLGTRQSVKKLLAQAFIWSKEGKCHLRVHSSSPYKVCLQLFSTDAQHHLTLDLWTELWQIDRKNQKLTYEICASHLLDSPSSIQQLPILLEACIFIHHLICKKKNITTEKQLNRLHYYQEKCLAENHTQLADALLSVIQKKRLTQEIESISLQLIHKHLSLHQQATWKRSMQKAAAALHSSYHRIPSTPKFITIMGCDGSGKTTLSRQIKQSEPNHFSLYTGKHLYRKWIIYKLLVIFLRPILFQKREKFDDTLAPLIYLLAAIRLRWKNLFSNKKTTLIDRSIVDFLMLERKTDLPHFSRFYWLTKCIGLRLPHIHVIVPYQQLSMRKLEMTEKGHARYDELMFEALTGRSPSDHTIFSNHSSLEDSTHALQKIMATIISTH